VGVEVVVVEQRLCVRVGRVNRWWRPGMRREEERKRGREEKIRRGAKARERERQTDRQREGQI